MAIEQLSADMVKLEKMKPEVSDKPFFSDSDRGCGIEVPPVDLSIIDENPDHPESDTYPDSDRDFSEGPQWNEQEIQSIDEIPEKLPIESAEKCVSDAGHVQETSKLESQEKEDAEAKDLLGTRELTDDEKRELKDIGMTDANIEKCRVKDGVVRLNCINEEYKGQNHPETNIFYTVKIVDIKGIKIEVVVPVFPSVFDTTLPEGLIQQSEEKQFNYCNERLKEAIKENPELGEKFSAEQREMIEAGVKPKGFTWHHNEEYGKMQLVKTEIHEGSRHTGGNSIWNGGN